MGVGEALIRYTDVEIHQQELCVLNDVNLELHKGEFVYLVGKVGSGKTSLLKTFYGELDIASGEAEVLGYDMLHIKRKHIPQLRRKHSLRRIYARGSSPFLLETFRLSVDTGDRNKLLCILKPRYGALRTIFDN